MNGKKPNPPAPLGEHEIEGGFRRISRPPAPNALVHLRALMLELARDGAPLVRQALGSFESWEWLATLCANEWGVVRASPASERTLRRRFLVLGTHPTAMAGAAGLAVGAAVHLQGFVQPLRPVLRSRLTAHMSYIWSRSAMSTHNVRLLVEEGHDFFLVDEHGESVRVIAPRGYLLDAPELAAGERISVFGCLDRVTAPSGAAGRAATALALRAGDDTPLLIRRAPRDA